MKKHFKSILLILFAVCILFSGCSSGGRGALNSDEEPIVYPENDKDFSALDTPGSQEAAYAYETFFLPKRVGTVQPYVGDPMPYYEDGTFYIYYLKDGGDSYNHSIYLTTTTDFVHFEEFEKPILEASRDGGQDSWIGTGSVVKIDDLYYLFYTGHTTSPTAEFKEKIMVAKGETLTSFEKVSGWEIEPPSELGQKRDFRDPQAYFDAETRRITLTITASQAGIARVLKYSLDSDLGNPRYEGILFSDPTETFWNLECSDTFQIGDRWYLTYSAQDDTLWYASSDSPDGPFSEAARLDGKLFYAAKHVEKDDDIYMAGWARRSESPSSMQEVSAWGGNIVVQQLIADEKGQLTLAVPDSVTSAFSNRRALAIESDSLKIESGARISYQDVFTAYERFLIRGRFSYSGKGSFGLAFDYSKRAEKYKLISIDPQAGKLQLFFNEGQTLITETSAPLEPNHDYTFTYLQEGSVGIFYLDGIAALTVRLYGASGKPIRLFTENNSVEFSALREYTR